MRLPSAPSSLRTRLLLGVAVLAALVVAGRYVGHHVEAIESGIAGLGPWAPLAFVVLFVIMAQAFVPESLLDTVAGALFGVLWGTVYTVVGSAIATAIAFWVSRRLASDRVRRLLETRPALAAIERAAAAGDPRLVLLLRMAPLNPTMVSYVLGVTRVRVSTFLLASVGLIPSHLVAVYFGYVARHVTQVASPAVAGSPVRTAATVGGLVACALLVGWLGHRAYEIVRTAGAATPRPAPVGSVAPGGT